MEGRGGRCIARSSYIRATCNYIGASKVDPRIMLRFRPIAPKPSSGPNSGGSSSDQSRDSNYIKTVGRRRGSRRYTQSSSSACKANNRKRCCRHLVIRKPTSAVQPPAASCSNNTTIKRPDTISVAASSSILLEDGKQSVVTLPLLPEVPEFGSRIPPADQKEGAGILLFRNNNDNMTLEAARGIINSYDGVMRSTDDHDHASSGTSYVYNYKLDANCFLFHHPRVALMREPPPSTPDEEEARAATWPNLSSHLQMKQQQPAVVVLRKNIIKAEAWVTVECVTGDTWTVDCWYSLERKNVGSWRKILRNDACPGFVSDGLGRVTWINTEFRRMVVGGTQKYNDYDYNYGDHAEEEEEEADVAVWLMIMNNNKQLQLQGQQQQQSVLDVPAAAAAANYFSCRVRMEYCYYSRPGCSSCEMNKNDERDQMKMMKLGGSTMKSVPCDLWRMDGGGFAWRLDVKAALTLGR